MTRLGPDSGSVLEYESRGRGFVTARVIFILTNYLD